VIRAEYLDDNQRVVATALDTVNITQSLYSINFVIDTTGMIVGEEGEIFCYLFQGTQEDPIRVGNKQIHFDSYVPNNEQQQGGYYVPSNIATAHETSANGMTQRHFFHATEPGFAILEAEYLNALNEVAARDTIIVRISEDEE
jgi:hypothetical protein